MARKSSDLRRIQGSQSEADAAWWDSVCGPEQGKLFRDQSVLADLALPSHWQYLDHIQRSGLKPLHVEKEAHRRVALSMRREHYEHALLHIGEGEAYPDNAAFLSDLTRTARLLVSELEHLVYEVGEERVHDRLKAIHPLLGRDHDWTGPSLDEEKTREILWGPDRLADGPTGRVEARD